MFYKILLCTVIICFSGLIGILKAYGYGERTRLLSEFMQASEKVRIEIEYRREPLPVIFERMSENMEKKVSGFFFQRVLDFREEKSLELHQCWEWAADEIYEKTALTSGDIMLIKELGNQLGRTGLSGQSKILELSLKQFEMQLAQAEEENRTKGKMYISLGFVAGILIVILII